MHTPSMDDSVWMKKTKWLTQALILSGTLNIGLMASMGYLAVKKASFPKVSAYGAKEQKTSKFLSSSSVDVIWDYFHAPYEKLLSDLSNEILVEDGLCKRDFALACLAEFYHFDIERALPGTTLAVRVVEMVHQDGGERATLKVFVGLQKEHFEAIESFAKTEKWPYTPEGLLLHLKQYEEIDSAPDSLKEAIFLTPQFHTVWMLFNRFEKTLPMETLLKLTQKIDFNILSHFHEEATRTQDYSLDRRREFLVELLKEHSPEASLFFLKYDADFALHKLSDPCVLELISYMTDRIPDVEEQLKLLLLSLRGHEVHQMAALRFFQLKQEIPPQQNLYKEAVKRFCQIHPQEGSSSHITQVEPSALPNGNLIHVVRKGESLWQIAKDHKVKLEDLKEINHLTGSSILRVGARLEIPQGTGS